jgi:triosephosphate isomerase
MRKNIVAGNWKMNTTLDEGVELANSVNALLKEKKANCDVIVCVPFTHLTSVNAVLDPECVKLGAENCSAKTTSSSSLKLVSLLLTAFAPSSALVRFSNSAKTALSTRLLRVRLRLSSISLKRISKRSLSLTNPFGLSVPEKPLLLTKLRICTLTSAT